MENVLKIPEKPERKSASGGNIRPERKNPAEKKGPVWAADGAHFGKSETISLQKLGFCIYFSGKAKLLKISAIVVEKEEFFGKVVAPGKGLLYNCSIKNMGKAQKMED